LTADSPRLSRSLARARELGPAIAAAAEEIERTRRIPAPLLDELHDSRLWRMLLPGSVGGDEIAPDVYLAAIEEVARHDGSVAWNLFVGNSAALIAPYLELEVARAIFADPKALVAWGPPNACRAHAVPGGYRVAGEWDFASGCRQATWMGVHCLVEEPDGSLRLNDAGRPTIRSLLFPVGEARLIDNWDPIGLRGTASDGYALDGLFVAEAFSTTREDPTLRREPGPLYAFPMQGLYAVGVAGVALGLARAMLDELVDLAQRKTPRGLVRMAQSPTVQAEVARGEAKLSAARAWLAGTLAELYGAAGPDAPIDVPARARVRLACSYAIHNAIEVATTTYRLAGVNAIFPDSPFERRFRDIHTVSQQIQSRASHFEAVGQVLLGVPPEVFL
jgi:alkylation response protein AidB-like acyl-CoA dehydrogenase